MNRLSAIIGLAILNLSVILSESRAQSPEVFLTDTTLKVGKLKNGFTYFLKKMQVPKTQVVFVVKVGKNQEGPDQISLAHVLEHMPFQQTKNFKDAMSFFSRLGVERGSEFNASTHNAYTIYDASIDRDKQATFRKVLEFYKECANDIVMSKENVEKGRASVLEESRRGSVDKAFKVSLIGDTKYKQLAQFDVAENTKNFKMKSLVDFYKKWYHPNQQAIIILGDINFLEVESQIKDLFSGLKAPSKTADPNIETTNLSELKWKNKLVIVPQLKSRKLECQIALNIPYKTLSNVDDFKRSFAANVFNRLMQSRFERYRTSGVYKYNLNPPRFEEHFAELGSRFSSLVSNNSFNDDSYTSALNEMLFEFEKIRRYGFSKPEIDEAKQYVVNNMRLYWGRGVQDLLNQIVMNFVYKDAILNPKERDSFIKLAINNMSPEYFNAMVKDWLKIRNNLTVTLRHSDGILREGLDMSKMYRMIDSLKVVSIDEYVMSTPNQGKQHRLLPEGTRHNLFESMKQVAFGENVNKELGIITLKMTNGIKVILKPMSSEDSYGKVNLKAFHLKFKNDSTDVQRFLSRTASNIISTSGLGQLNQNELEEFYKQNRIEHLTPYITKDIARFGGAFDSSAFEEVLQAIYLYLTSPKIQDDILHARLLQANNKSENIKHPTRILQDTIAIYRNGMKAENRGDTLKLETIDAKTVIDYYSDRFCNTDDLVFIFAGDFNWNDVLATKIGMYLATIPKRTNARAIKQHNVSSVKKPVDVVLNSGESRSSTVNVLIADTFSYSPKNVQILELIKHYINDELYSRLREKEKGIYSLIMNLSIKRHLEQFDILFEFECAPENVSHLIECAKDEFNKLNRSPFNDHLLQQLKSSRKNKIKENLLQTGFWLDYIPAELRHAENFNNILYQLSAIDEITTNDIFQFVNSHFNSSKFSTFVLNPANSK